jgi:hypothetical protein
MEKRKWILERVVMKAEEDDAGTREEDRMLL